ncbi:uncharacterized protein LOC126282067 [Schistocerca gregaria]|uniref:uncharacterized protein LOC126282067 n=1 Tax=Schistocerca gregaria TaxID=7010 RepID=UPI00211DEF5C|nr:uncharacterized protein LOC126282067 [Schistocerca gregaria]
MHITMFVQPLLLLTIMNSWVAQNAQGLMCSDMTLQEAEQQHGAEITGLNTSCNVAQLVSSGLLALKQPQTPSSRDRGGSGGNTVAAVFRLLGLEPSRLRAVTLNSLLFIAQLISNFFIQQGAPKNTGKQGKKHQDSLLPWILQNPTVQKFVPSIKDQSLADRVMDAVNGHISQYANLTCSQLLICRLMPFIRGMQRSVIPLLSEADFYSMTGINIFFSSLPEEKEMEDITDKCDLQYPGCVY